MQDRKSSAPKRAAPRTSQVEGHGKNSRPPTWIKKPWELWHLQRDDRWVTPFFKGKNIIQYYKVLNIWCVFFGGVSDKNRPKMTGVEGGVHVFNLFLITHISYIIYCSRRCVHGHPTPFSQGSHGNQFMVDFGGSCVRLLAGKMFQQLPNVRNNHHFQDNSPTKCRYVAERPNSMDEIRPTSWRGTSHKLKGVFIIPSHARFRSWTVLVLHGCVIVKVCCKYFKWPLSQKTQQVVRNGPP